MRRNGGTGEATDIKQAGEDTARRPSMLPLKEGLVYAWEEWCVDKAKASILQS